MWGLRSLVAIAILATGGLAMASAMAPLSVAGLRYSVLASGLVLSGIGGWQLRCFFTKGERRYTLLRRELDQFIGLTRQLHKLSRAAHDAPTAIYQQSFDEIKTSMQVSVERMVTIAHVSDR